MSKKKQQYKPEKDDTFDEVAWLSFVLGGRNREEEALDEFFKERYVPKKVGDTFRISGYGYSPREHYVILRVDDPWLLPSGVRVHDVMYTIVGMTDEKDGFYPLLGFISLDILEKYAYEGRLTQ